MKLKMIAISLFAVVMLSCSSNNEDDSSGGNCEEDGFGYLKINLPSNNTYRTAITITASNGQLYDDEIVPAKQTSTIIDIDAGVYSISVVSIDNNGNAVSEPLVFAGISILQCETTERKIGRA